MILAPTKLKLFLCCVLFSVNIGSVFGDELVVNKINYNTISIGGLPLSITPNQPPGSNGKAPSNEATVGQFKAFLAFGATASPNIEKRKSLDLNKSYSENSKAIGLPRSSNVPDDEVLIMTRGVVGAPFFGRQTSFLIGQFINKPKEKGGSTNQTLIVNPNFYWADEPFIPNINIKSIHENKENKVISIITESKHELLPGDIIYFEDTNLGDNQHIVKSVTSDDEFIISSESMQVPEEIQSDGASFKLGHESKGYYYSKHNKQVIAIQPGPINITWRENVSVSEKPQGKINIDWVKINGTYYQLYEETYMVSASASSDVQVMYWNKDPWFDGPQIGLPKGVGELKIIYNKNFPKVVNPEDAVGIKVDGSGAIVQKEYRTLWVEDFTSENSALMALNKTGRVIIELLGDPTGDDTRKHIGYEIIDVRKISTPTDNVLELGERLRPFDDGKIVLNESLKVDMRDSKANTEESFILEKTLPETTSLVYYAIRETQNQNDVVAFWKNKGLGGIEWPVYHNRYHLEWPTDSSKYSHYLRPLANKKDAIKSAVQLPLETNPDILYQDKDKFGKKRAVLPQDGKFYTWLDEDFPTHRTLISYETAVGGIAFEHVFSWLDQTISDGNWPTTKETKHLDQWPKLIIDGNQGIPVAAQGNILVRIFKNLSKNDSGISSVLNDKKFPNFPDSQIGVEYFEYPNKNDANVVGFGDGDNYGSQLIGYFHPDKNGWYKFGLDVNNNGQLWLSSDSTLQNKNLIISNSVLSDNDDFRNYSKATSDAIWLEKGRAYFIECIHHSKRGSYDRVSVSFSFSSSSLDDIPSFNSESRPIDGRYLSPWLPENDTSGGLKVLSLKYPFNKGQVIHFESGAIFQFSEPASIGDTLVHGNLIGMISDGETGAQPNIAIAPKVQATIDEADTPFALNFDSSKRQTLETQLKLSDTDQSTEFWFKTNVDNAGLFYAKGQNNYDRSLYLENGNLVGNVSTINKKKITFETNTDALSDNLWHHVAFTISTGDITSPGNPIIHTSDLPDSSFPAKNAIDNDIATSFVHKSNGEGLIVNTQGGIINAIGITSASNLDNADPNQFSVFGSRNGGLTFQKIANGEIPKFNFRNERIEIKFDNQNEFRIYKVILNSNRSNKYHIGEIELIDLNRSRGLTLYLDGENIYKNPNILYSSNIDQNSITFGHVPNKNYYDGELLNIRIWDHNRTATQIKDYKNSTIPNSTQGLIGYFNFRDLSNSSAKNLGSGNDAQLKNYINTLDTIAGLNHPVSIPVSPLKISLDLGDKLFFKNNSFLEITTAAKPGDKEIKGFIKGKITEGESATLVDSKIFYGPRYVSREAEMGSRLKAPNNEIGSAGGDKYWAGYIHSGSSYNVNAYINPLERGFDAANSGAIIPINNNPTDNKLTVYWFRDNKVNNDPNLGFMSVYWPSVIGKYTIIEPKSSREIILASNSGSGALTSLEQKGKLYRQPIKDNKGYNPNEEHAIMLGGTIWALRCDLNQTDKNYTSPPYVLLEYTDDDSRPSMSLFKVLLEKPSEGVLFDYITEAGSVLQAPMPLPLLDKPISDDPSNIGELLDSEFPYDDSLDWPNAWSDNDKNEPRSVDHYGKFTFIDRKNTTWVFRGQHTGTPVLKIGRYLNGELTNLIDAVAVVNEPFSYYVHCSRWKENVQMVAEDPENFPEWLTIDGLEIKGTPPLESLGNTEKINIIVNSLDGESAPGKFSINVSNIKSDFKTQHKQDITINGFRYIDRPSYLSENPTASNSFRMKFWYKNLKQFDWPADTIGNDGSYKNFKPGDNIQYLKTPDEIKGLTIRDHGDRDYVVYRPIWPKSAPSLRMGETLTLPKFGLPALRGQSSVNILYQESIASKSINPSGSKYVYHESVKLHDPTRYKIYEIPDTVKTFPPDDMLISQVRGKTYFPSLPPHLSNRLFYDDNIGTNGALVFRGEFVDEIVGEKYLLLNLIKGEDKQIISNLSNEDSWKTAVNNLKTTMTSFKPKRRDDNTVILGVYEKDRENEINVGDLSKVKYESTPVDSYALSASGGNGYVTLIMGNGNGKTTPDSAPVSMHIIKVVEELYQGELKVIVSNNALDEKVSLRHSGDFAGDYSSYEFEWRKALPVDGVSPPVLIGGSLATDWILLKSDSGVGKNSYIRGGVGIDTLLDMYYIMRYKPINTENWSEWTKPKFCQGWIKRVLAEINPFNQRVNDLFSNKVNTDVSILTQAGKRSEGDVALNMDSINDFGLIEIYETVMNRAKGLSIHSGINEPGANKALLLAAGYLNDLYMMLGNEAYADSVNPTIGFGTGHGEYGDIATSMFAFKGQVSTLMDEELALLRGRDDFLQPDVEVAPVYNRLFWNYTRGIDSGEVIYALNYNIQERGADKLDGNVDAADASIMYPQGHGDAYGHYLTAIKGYYQLIVDNEFEWIPQSESVNVLGQEVTVDYLDERKFAKAALSLARTGSKIYELTWRKDYHPDTGKGWGHMEKTRSNSRREFKSLEGDNKNTTRYWGQDHWAARVGTGSYLNWVIGNSMIPANDNDPTHEGVRKIDRTTVTELLELADIGRELQITVDNSATSLNPLGLPEDTVPFDIDPSFLEVGSGIQGETHFDQIYNRAVLSLNNAVSAFNESKNITQVMRTEEDSLQEIKSAIDQEELGYKHRLIEIYGTPYADDIGPGKLYKQGYDGPDLLHYQYIRRDTLSQTKGDRMYRTYKINRRALLEGDIEDAIDNNSPSNAAFHTEYVEADKITGSWYFKDWSGYIAVKPLPVSLEKGYVLTWPNKSTLTLTRMASKGDTKIYGNIDSKENIAFTAGQKAPIAKNIADDDYNWTKIKKANWEEDAYQFAIESLFKGNELSENEETFVEYTIDSHGFFVKPDNYRGTRSSPGEIQLAINDIVQSHNDLLEALRNAEGETLKLNQLIKMTTSTRDMKRVLLKAASEIAKTEKGSTSAQHTADTISEIIDFGQHMGETLIGMVDDNMPEIVIAGFSMGGDFAAPAASGIQLPLVAAITIANATKFGVNIHARTENYNHLANKIDWETVIQVAQDQDEIKKMLFEIEEATWNLANAELAVDTADRSYYAAIDRYKSLVASGNRLQKERENFRKRAAAKIQGYRTRDASFRIFRNEKLERYKSLFDLSARYTYFAAKAFDYETGLLNTDKGKRFLSRIVASRALGVVDDGEPQFAGSNAGDPGLSSVLAEMKSDWDVLKGRLGFNNPDTYGTTASLRSENFRILPGSAGETEWEDILLRARKKNLLADPDIKELCMQLANDNGLPVPGIVIEFYTLIADGYNLFGRPLASGDHSFSPTSFATKILAAGVVFEGYEGMSNSESDDGNSITPIMLNPKGLSATPYVYLIPVGVDSMRSPPLGDRSIIRQWQVQDATIPMPFNVGGSEFGTRKLWQSNDSLSEQLFNVRKHQAFRAVDSTDFFGEDLLTPPNKFSNNRLIGRSVWNSKWKLVIPGKTLLDDSEEGLDLFINTVKDIKIHFETYSYSGN